MFQVFSSFLCELLQCACRFIHDCRHTLPVILTAAAAYLETKSHLVLHIFLLLLSNCQHGHGYVSLSSSLMSGTTGSLQILMVYPQPLPASSWSLSLVKIHMVRAQLCCCLGTYPLPGSDMIVYLTFQSLSCTISRTEACPP